MYRRLTVSCLAIALVLAFSGSASAANAPSGGCPSGGNFVEKEQNLPPGTKGAPSTSVNESTQACFKVLPNAPQQLKDLIGVETVEVVVDDVRRSR